MRNEQSSPLSESITSSGHNISNTAGEQLPNTKPVTFFDRWLTRKLLDAIGNPPVAFRLWNGEDIVPAGLEPEAVLNITSRRAIIKLILDPEYNFGELYCSRDIDVEGNLVRFLQIVTPASHYKPKSFTARVLELVQNHRPDRNSITRSRKNIYHHYDIGNEFYKLWLDREAMQYTCAYYPDPAMTLEQAQVAKMHHVCRKLNLEPGQTVVEAGCGWGGLARFMAREYGVTVKAYNISHQQILYAREQAQAAGLANQVEYIEDDFRNIVGEFDRFVSVGMLEHIGIGNYHELGRVIDRSLKEDGFGLIHTIGRNQPCLLNAWIESRIFPGACPPSLGQMTEIFEPFMFSVLDVENLRLHYELTLQHWLDRFDANVESVRKTYDDAFIRAWRLYLAGSIAAFHTGTLQLFQVLFTRPRNNHLEWSRNYIYQTGQQRP